jgi:hypothetical protein
MSGGAVTIIVTALRVNLRLSVWRTLDPHNDGDWEITLNADLLLIFIHSRHPLLCTSPLRNHISKSYELQRALSSPPLNNQTEQFYPYC